MNNYKEEYNKSLLNHIDTTLHKTKRTALTEFVGFVNSIIKKNCVCNRISIQSHYHSIMSDPVTVWFKSYFTFHYCNVIYNITWI